MKKIEAELAKHSPSNLTEALDQIGNLAYVVNRLVEVHNELLEAHNKVVDTIESIKANKETNND